MTDTGTAKSKSGNLNANEEQRKEERRATEQTEEHDLNQGLEAEEEQLEEGRRTTERNEQQDLNQGMETGTHSSAHQGVSWGPSYRIRSKIDHPLPIKEQIAARAYEIYLQRGGEDGHDLEDWLLAEKELKQGRTKAN